MFLSWGHSIIRNTQNFEREIIYADVDWKKLLNQKLMHN